MKNERRRAARRGARADIRIRRLRLRRRGGATSGELVELSRTIGLGRRADLRRDAPRPGTRPRRSGSSGLLEQARCGSARRRSPRSRAAARRSLARTLRLEVDQLRVLGGEMDGDADRLPMRAQRAPRRRGRRSCGGPRSGPSPPARTRRARRRRRQEDAGRRSGRRASARRGTGRARSPAKAKPASARERQDRDGPRGAARRARRCAAPPSGVNGARRASRPPRPAATKSSAQVPTVKPRVTMAALALLRQTAAAATAIADRQKRVQEVAEEHVRRLGRGEVAAVAAPEEEREEPPGSRRRASRGAARRP